MPEILTKFDLSQPTWIKVKNYLEAELLKLRVRNDEDMNEVETALLRGEIKRIKMLLALEKEPVEIEDDSARFKDGG